MDSMLASSAVNRGFEPRSGQSKHYTIGICCVSTKFAAIRSKSKDWLARNQNNVSEWNNMSTRWLLVQWASSTYDFNILREIINKQAFADPAVVLFILIFVLVIYI